MYITYQWICNTFTAILHLLNTVPQPVTRTTQKKFLKKDKYKHGNWSQQPETVHRRVQERYS